MGRIRTIKPDLFDSGSLAKVSRDARYFFVGLLTLADDEGRMRYLPKKIVGELYPYDEDVTTQEVIKWTDELAKRDSVRLYAVEDETYLYLPGWGDHQRISHPAASKYPDPEECLANSSGEVPESFRNHSGEVPEPLANTSGEVLESFRPEREKEGEREREREGAIAPPKPKRKSRLPADFALTPEIRSWPTAVEVAKAGGSLEDEFEKFRDWHTAKGSTFLDWPAAFRTWLRGYRPKPTAPAGQGASRFAALAARESTGLTNGVIEGTGREAS